MAALKNLSLLLYNQPYLKVRYCKLGKAQSLQSEATQRSLPVVRLNLCFLRVRVDDEGLEVRWEQRDSQVDVNPVYCVFDHS